MVYNVIGLMSGSSLDGLDIAYVEISEIGGNWSFELLHTECIPYEQYWIEKLKNAHNSSITDLLDMHTEYGRFLGMKVNEFIDKYSLYHKVHLIASHGHTIYHNPKTQTSFQLGEGGSISALTQLNVVSDLRNKDVALQGQGAPIVPIADKYFWNEYDFCLNIGGIANITILQDNVTAFDICTANQVLNYFAQQKGENFDIDGKFANNGSIQEDKLKTLNQLDYFQIKGPKSLSNDFCNEYISILKELKAEDALATMCEHIAIQIKHSIENYLVHPSQKLFITGGGAHNLYLVNRIRHHLPNLEVITAESTIIDFKEAIAMALIGVLRWREETNAIASVTGAVKDSVGGALWVN